MPISFGRPAVKTAAIGLMIANCVSHYFNLHPIVLICDSLNPRCPTDLEEPTPVSEPAHPVTPTRPSRNDGASRANSDAEDQYRQSDEEEGLGAKKFRPPRHVLKYEVVKRWVTGERAELDDDKINSELEDLMREHMELSCQRRFFGHRINPTDKGLWKLARFHTDKRGIRYDVWYHKRSRN